MINNKKRIIVNARFLSQEITGVQRFAIEISLRLRKHFDEKTLIFLAPNNILHNTVAEELKAVIVGRKNGHLWEQFELPFHLKSTDLLVNFCNTAPIFHARKIVTIHDLAFNRPEKWHSSMFRIYYKCLIPLLIKSSLRFFTVSETIKNELKEFYDFKNKEIDVIYNAVSIPENESINTVENKERYILFVGSLDPRKNLKGLIEAFQYIKDQNLRLKIVGGRSKSFKTVEMTSLDSRIEFLGRQTDLELQQLYQNALTFVYPSLYEGFGIPILEALSNSCPVLASDIPVFREIFANCVTYFNPKDVYSLADTINNIAQLQKDEIKKHDEIVKHISKYSWDKSSKDCIHAISCELDHTFS